MNRIFIAVIFFLLCSPLICQPGWYRNPPVSSSGKYCYVSVKATGGEDMLDLALEKSIVCLGISRSEFTRRRVSGANEGVIEVGSKVLNFKKVREKNVGNTTYVLMVFSQAQKKIPRKIVKNPLPITISLSALLPSTGQYYKKQKLRGTVYLVSFLGAVGVASYYQLQIRSDKDKLRQAASIFEREALIKSMKDNRNIRNISLGGAGLVYLINLVDAAASRGQRYAMQRSNKKLNWELAYEPAAGIPIAGLNIKLSN